jgi:lipopolysaccharide export system permease protein
LQHLRELVIQVRTDLLTQVIQPGKFSSPEQGLTFHIRDRAPNGELLGVIMHDARKGVEGRSYLAERALVVKQEDAAYVVMTDGHIVRRHDPTEPAQIIAFEKYAINLDQFERRSAEETDLKPRERYFSELAWPEATSAGYKVNPGQFRAELHERFANPLYPIAFVLVALAAVGHAQSTRQSRVENLAGAFLIATGCRFAGLAFNNLSVLNAAAAAGLYAIPILTSAAALYFIARLAKPHSSLGLGEKALDALAPLAARLGRLARRVPAFSARQR